MDIQINADTIVCFDLDDTLYPEIEYLKSGFKYLALKIAGQNWLKVYYEMFSRYRCGANAFEYISKQYNVPIGDLLEEYRNHLPQLSLVGGALDILKGIKAKGGRIAVITDGRSKTQRNKITALGIDSYVDCLVISQEIGTEKPSLPNFRVVMENLVGTTYWYIADNLKKDFITPKKLGWNTIGLIDNGTCIHKEAYKYMLPEYEPSHYIFGLDELKIRS